MTVYNNNNRLKLRNGRGENRICQVNDRYTHIHVHLYIHAIQQCICIYTSYNTKRTHTHTQPRHACKLILIYTMYILILPQQVYDSPTLAETECGFSLGPGGVDDPKDA